MPLNPNLSPDLRDLRAVVTTRWNGNSYRPLSVQNIEAYYVDTALDNDADTWVVEIGDPRGDFLELAVRDSEIRVQLFGLGRSNFIMTGIADDANYTDGTWTLTGRDYSSLATDSTIPPAHFRQVRAWAVVEQQAKQLKFPKVNVAHGRMVRKVFFTDGSESYWDFWWRLYRKEQMWIWCDAEGQLVASTLNYSDSVDYYLGDPRDTDSASIRRAHIPVESLEIRKSTQARVGEVHVFWHKGDNGARTIVKDPTMTGWMKRPIKIMMDTDAHSASSAKKTALEEIFESKVGSVEYKLTIPDPGFPIRQNKIVRLHLPEIGLLGQFFVVGARYQGGTDGFVQEVRLREKQYAITRRVPTDPKLTSSQPSAGVMSSGMGAALEDATGVIPKSWGNYFIKAAKEFHGPWDYQLFLATLIGICHQETGGAFLNERQNGGPGGDHIEWYPFGGTMDPSSQHQHGEAYESRRTWEEKFANEKNDGYVSTEYGVGPMQLTSRGLKNDADDRLRANFRNEFSGGRWHPEHNIWVAASYLRSCLKALVGDSGRDIDMWMGVSAYNKGTGGAKLLDPYALAVKNFVYNDPGYLADIKQAVQTAAQNYGQATGTPPSSFGPLGSMYRYNTNIIGQPNVVGSTHDPFAYPNNWESDNAYDIKAPFGSIVYAVHDGEVISRGVQPDNDRPVVYPTPDSMLKLDRFGGNRIEIVGKDQSTYYAHLSRVNTSTVRVGGRVKQGDVIGWTGIANGSFHLHFACMKGNPVVYLPGVS